MKPIEITVDIDAPTDNSAWHQSKVWFTAGEDTVNWASTCNRTAKRLAFTYNNISAISARGFNKTEGNWLNRNNQCCVLTYDLLEQWKSTIENAERIGLFDVNTAGTCSLLRRGQIHRTVWVMPQHFDLNFCTLTVIFHDRQAIGRCQF